MIGGDRDKIYTYKEQHWLELGQHHGTHNQSLEK